MTATARESGGGAAPGGHAWRREVDGLRAVAVLPVILFHAAIPGFSGGYLGVDVFFVISGYLITGILLRDLAAGRFSIARFYERRARRILPALTVVLLACIPFGLAWMSPLELTELSKGIVAAALSVSNFLFWQQLDYFGPAAEHLPLLHTWSLGIEEQFYVLFPLALAALWRWRPERIALWLGLAALVSLAVAAWASARYPSAAFFLLPFRAWELLAGALVAVAMARPGARGPAALPASAGLGLLVAAMAAVPLGLPAGVLPALGACLGTALIIRFAGPGSMAYRLLAHPAPVAIGLISYSAYLWHQPILAFARIRFGDALPPLALLALGGLALVLAWPTWALVEQPFRRAGRGTPLRPLAIGGATLVALVAVGGAGIATQGLATAKSAAVQAIVASAHDTNPWRDACKTGLTDANPVHPRPACLIDGALPAVAFWGDSHADSLQGGLFPAAEAAGFRFYSVNRSACPPATGLTRTGGAASPACDAFNRDMEAYVRQADFPVVVLAARWTSGVATHPYDNGDGGVEGAPGDFLTPIGAAPADDAARQAAVIAAYVATVERLLADGFRVVLVYPIPEAGWNVPEELIRRREASAEPVTLSAPRTAFDARQAAVITAFDAIESPHLWRVRPDAVLCDGALPGRCVQSIGDQALYFDESHLNNAGARMVAPAIVAAIEAARQDVASPAD